LLLLEIFGLKKCTICASPNGEGVVEAL
jgi:hypothetical protein